MRKVIRTEAEINPFDGAAKIVPTVLRREHRFGPEEKTEAEEERTMKVKMNKDMTICVDGINPIDFKMGDTMDLPVQIASALLEDNRASKIEIETKALAGAPENKMMKGPKSNKRRG